MDLRKFLGYLGIRGIGLMDQCIGSMHRADFFFLAHGRLKGAGLGTGTFDPG
jgi:hypothetical protein